MKGKRKLFALILSLAMVSSMFAACNNAEDNTQSGAGSGDGGSQSGEEYSPRMAEPTTITWYMWDKQPTKTSLIDKANEMSMEAINVDVDFKWTAGVQETVNTKLASGADDLDIVYASTWFADYFGNANRGYFKDITEDLPIYAPDLAEFLPEKLIEGITVKGRLYCVPCWKDTAAEQYWFARTDILEAADAMEDMKNCNEDLASVRPVLEKIKAWHDADPENNRYSEGNTAPWNMNWSGLNGWDNGWDVLHSDSYIGVQIEEGNTKVECMLANQDWRDMMKVMKAYADEGLTNGLEAIQIEQDPTLHTFSTGQGWDGAQYDSWGGPKKGYEVTIQKKCGPYLTSGYCAGGVNCIGTNSKKVEAALKYMQYLNMDKAFRNFMRYGEEGVDWEEVDGRARVLTNDSWMLASFAVGTFKTLLVPANVDEEHNVLEVQPPVDMYDNICAQVDTATASDLLGFSVNIDKVKNQIASCTSIALETRKNLLCGAVKDVDAYCDDVLNRMNAVGLQDVLDEFQNQVNEFLSGR